MLERLLCSVGLMKIEMIVTYFVKSCTKNAGKLDTMFSAKSLSWVNLVNQSIIKRLFQFHLYSSLLAT